MEEIIKTNNFPKVSIVIPVYNGSNYLKEAIESAINQTYPNIEIIVINDGSTDGGATAEAAKLFADQIIYLEKENGGISTALNLGIKIMNGDYFSWLSHDDVYLPHKIQSQVDFAQRENGKFVYSDYKYINEIGEELKINTEVADLSNLGPMIYQLMVGYPINGCATLIHKDVFKKCGMFDSSLPSTQDYDYWFRVSQQVVPIYLNECVLKSRIHHSQGSRTMKFHINECNLLYHKMAWHYVSSKMHLELGSEFTYKLVSSLISRNLLSGADLVLDSMKVKKGILLEFRLIYRSLRKKLRNILLPRIL